MVTILEDTANPPVAVPLTILLIILWFIYRFEHFAGRNQRGNSPSPR